MWTPHLVSLSIGGVQLSGRWESVITQAELGHGSTCRCRPGPPARPPWQPDAAPVGGRSADCGGPGSRPWPQITEDLPFLSRLTSCPLLFVTFPARLHPLLCQSWPIFTEEGAERRSFETDKEQEKSVFLWLYFFKERKPLHFFIFFLLIFRNWLHVRLTQQHFPSCRLGWFPHRRVFVVRLLSS